MTQLCIDFETYYDNDYSLKKVPNFEYITDPRFKAHGLAVQIPGGAADWVDHAHLRDWVAAIDWDRITMVGHNLYFDAAILAWVYGAKPSAFIDTQGISRMLVKPTINAADLDSVADFLGIGRKIQGTLASVKGVRDLSPDQSSALGEYAKEDVRLTTGILQRLAPHVPDAEWGLISLHTDLYLRKRVKISDTKLKAVLKKHEDFRARLAAKAQALWPQVLGGPTDDTFGALRKNKNVAEIIKQEQQLPPRKRSLTTGKHIYAFSQTDLAFLGLRGLSDNLRTLVDAKTHANSTVLTNKITRLQLMNRRLGWAHPMLNYAGAHTLRSSGGDKLNFQALQKKPPEFRHSFVPPRGHKIIVADSAQIEARVLAWLAGQDDLIEAFYESDAVLKTGGDPKLEGKDVYTMMAKKIGSEDRQLGKAVTLGCGFGMSEDRFVLTSRINGVDIAEIALRKAHYGWRKANPKIVQFWATLENALRKVVMTGETQTVGKLRIERGLPWDEAAIRIELPSGRPMIYGKVRVLMGNLLCARSKLWYGMLVENVVQAVARDVVFYQTMQYPGLCEKLWIMVHDELNLVDTEAHAPATLELALQALGRELDCFKGLPVAGEGGVYDHLVKG